MRPSTNDAPSFVKRCAAEPPKKYNSAPPPTVAYTVDMALAVAANAVADTTSIPVAVKVRRHVTDTICLMDRRTDKPTDASPACLPG